MLLTFIDNDYHNQKVNSIRLPGTLSLRILEAFALGKGTVAAFLPKDDEADELTEALLQRGQEE